MLGILGLQVGPLLYWEFYQLGQMAIVHCGVGEPVDEVALVVAVREDAVLLAHLVWKRLWAPGVAIQKLHRVGGGHADLAGADPLEHDRTALELVGEELERWQAVVGVELEQARRGRW